MYPHEVQVGLAVNASNLPPHGFDAVLAAGFIPYRQLRKDRQHFLLNHRPCGFNGFIQAAAVAWYESRRAERLHDWDAVTSVGFVVVANEQNFLAEDLGLDLVSEVPHEALHVVAVSGVVDLKVAVVVFEALGNCAVQCEAFAAMLGRRDGKPLAFDVEDFLLVLPAVERCLQESQINIVGEYLPGQSR